RFRELLADSRLKLLDVPGGYFQLVDYSEISSSDDINFSEWLVREGGVAGIPLAPFYETPPADARLLRLCFAKSDGTMEAAAERLCKL
ncbi:MAG: aminotransferase class I/II-fold pyridoxal phosphate-dependent enzyme, partial [Rhodanobacteraceae bacterium]